MPHYRLTPEELDWLRDGWRRWRLPEITARFNAWSGRTITETQMRGILHRHKFQSGRPPGLFPGERPAPVWKPEYIGWLRRHRPILTMDETKRRFNAHFGLKMTRQQIIGACNRHNIRANDDGRFLPGEQPWNAGRRDVCLAESFKATQFQPGHRPHTWRPIGSYRKCRTDGYWSVKVRDERTNTGRDHAKNWIEVHRLTYQDYHGPIPPGHIVVLLDGDPDNCLDPDNVAAIPRSLLARLNALDWGSAPDLETRLALLAMARLHETASQRAEDIGIDKKERAKLIKIRRKPYRRPARQETAA